MTKKEDLIWEAYSVGEHVNINSYTSGEVQVFAIIKVVISQ